MTSTANLHILNQQEMSAKMRELKDQGFDRIKFPGGTSKDKTHFSGIVRYKFDGKHVFLLVLPYNSRFHLEGNELNGNKKDGETPESTACRELYEETGTELGPEDIHEMESVRNELKFPGEPAHTKYWFLSKQEGAEKPFKAFLPDGEIGEPFWAEIGILREFIYSKHAKALIAAAEILALDKDMCQAVMRVFE